MRKLRKLVHGKAATVENCGVVQRGFCRCGHDYCQCGSSPSDYIASDNQHYWSSEASELA